MARLLRRYGICSPRRRKVHNALCCIGALAAIYIVANIDEILPWVLESSSRQNWPFMEGYYNPDESFLARYNKFVSHQRSVVLVHKKSNLCELLHSSFHDGGFHQAVMKDKYLNYLRPTNTFFPNISLQLVNPERKLLIEAIFRTGYGLKPYATETGEATWIENGVVYRPLRPETIPGMENSQPQTDYEAYVPFDEDLFFEGRKSDSSFKWEKKIILWHTPSAYIAHHDDLKPMELCPEFPCQVATNVDLYYNRSSAVIFAAHLIKGFPPARTSPNQVYVFHNHEPPNNKLWTNQYRKPEWKSVFNWTFTYRMDSDIVMPYGIIRKRPKPVEYKDYGSIVKEKKGLVAWIVSNCDTMGLREWYIAELEKYVKIDIHGNCGYVQCSHEYDRWCADEIGKDYKFLLSFENSICTDYVSEKVFRYLSRNIVIVARGSDEYYQHLPSDIFINSNNFPSPKHLADLLIFLDKSPGAYISILREKDKYMSIFEDYQSKKIGGAIATRSYLFGGVPMCLMCQRLWNLKRHTKKIDDIKEWFDLRTCRMPTDLGFMSKSKNETVDAFRVVEDEVQERIQKARRRLEMLQRRNRHKKRQLEELKGKEKSQ